MKNPWKTLSSKKIYENAWLKLREDKVITPNGKKGIYGVVEYKPSVFIMAINERNEIYLIKQFRYTVKQSSWELPAGSIDTGSPLAAAKKELWEETGLTAKRWKKAGTYFGMISGINHQTHVFIAQDLNQTHLNQQPAEGITNAKKFSFNKILQMIADGTFIDGETITALTIAAVKLELI